MDVQLADSTLAPETLAPNVRARAANPPTEPASMR